MALTGCVVTRLLVTGQFAAAVNSYRPRVNGIIGASSPLQSSSIPFPAISKAAGLIAIFKSLQSVLSKT